MIRKPRCSSGAIADTVHGNIIRVLDILRSVGFYKVAFEIKSQATAGVPGPGPGGP